MMWWQRPSAVLAAMLVCFHFAGCHDIGAEPPLAPTIESGTDAPADNGDETEGSPETADAGGDAFDDSVDAASLDVSEIDSGSVTTVLTGRSDSCLDCAEASCSAYVHGCDTIRGAAADGPAKGTPKSALCAETLQCMFSTQCGTKDVSLCYCGPPAITGDPSDCYRFPASNTGACKTTLEGAAESTIPETVVTSFSDTSKGSGWALLLLQCLNDNRCRTCFTTE